MSSIDHILRRLDAYHEALSDISQARPRIDAAVAQHYQSVPIRQDTGQMAQSFRDPHAPGFASQATASTYTYINGTPYAVYHLPERPDAHIFTQAMAEHVRDHVQRAGGR